jgi:hypothetical protein
VLLTETARIKPARTHQGLQATHRREMTCASNKCGPIDFGAIGDAGGIFLGDRNGMVPLGITVLSQAMRLKLSEHLSKSQKLCGLSGNGITK